MFFRDASKQVSGMMEKLRMRERERERVVLFVMDTFITRKGSGIAVLREVEEKK